MGEQLFTPEQNLQNEVSPADIKKILGEILASAEDEEELQEASSKISNIRTTLLERFNFDDLQASPYWHAVAGSTVRPEKKTEPTPVKGREIAELVIGSVKRLVESFELSEHFGSAIESSNTLIQDIALFRERLSVDPGMLEYFNREMNAHVQVLQALYPGQPITEIPEVQYIISGSEKVSGKGVTIETSGHVALSLTEKYLAVKDLISDSINLGSEERS